MGLLNVVALWIYQAVQVLTAIVFSPSPPPPNQQLRGPRIAVIGAGISGVSAAAHCVGHGFEVKLFEASAREGLGGIWARVNNTSSLQIHSVMYRFHPSVRFRKTYPDRQRILEETTHVWESYHLDERTEFGVRVQHVWRDEKTGRWIVHDRKYGTFDGVIAAVGTCGEPKVPHIPGQDQFEGDIFHSSQLNGREENVKGQMVVVVGGGASAVEAVEFAVQKGAAKTTILARSDKWIIPRNPFLDVLLAAGPLGKETSLSWIPESLLSHLFYRDLADLAPAEAGLFTETPMVNDAVLEHIREGTVSWMRGDIEGLTPSGVRFRQRARRVPVGGPGREETVPARVIIMATGFHRPSLAFLPSDAFQPDYMPPNWFLQVFPIGHFDLCALNCTYLNAIGTVGNIHIGIYTRFLLMFVVDPRTRPSRPWMRLWVDWTRVMKKSAPGGALDFFTYGELAVWFLLTLIMNPFRWKWALFVLTGWGFALPPKLLEEEGLAGTFERVGHDLIAGTPNGDTC